MDDSKWLHAFRLIEDIYREERSSQRRRIHYANLSLRKFYGLKRSIELIRERNNEVKKEYFKEINKV